MSIYDKTVQVARKTMTLFFLIDNSGSMSGSKIGAVNQAIEEVIPEIKNISSQNADAEIKIAVMTFSDTVKWVTQFPVEADLFYWNDITAEGVTSFYTACGELNKKLSKSEFMQSASGSYAPAIFLMSDGYPTDEYNSKMLDELKQNNWFKKAIKVALAIGDDTDKNVLSSFTGTSEAVLTAHTPETLMKMIKFVSVTSSQIGSKSSAVGSNKVDQVSSKQDDMVMSLQSSSLATADADEDVDQW